MPMNGPRFTPSAELLTAAELESVVRAAARLGFRKIRLTGGEPTLRADLLEIIARVHSVKEIHDLGLTTNGVLFPPLAEALYRAGLKRVNVHLDSLNPDRLKRVMRFGTLDEIWAGILAAESAGFRPIKINAVVARDYNHEDVIDLAQLTVQRPWHVRFIELMPLGNGECAKLSWSHFVANAETRARIEEALGPLQELASADPSDESRNYHLPGALGVVGFISPVSDPYCGTCNRMRLTADGKFHLCLLSDDEIDVKPALRNGGGLDEVTDLLAAAIAAKPVGHRLGEGISPHVRQMFQLGG
jgi:cyclic pyranopterin phosphate synthase